MTRFIVFLAICLILISKSSSSEEAPPSCSKVTGDLIPCVGFIKGKDLLDESAAEPSKACCKGVKEISDSVKTRDDRTTVCKCIQKALAMAGSYNPSRIPLLPKKCGVAITLPPIDSKTDCTKAMYNPPEE